MNSTLAHRGPDDSGVYCSPDGRVVLANRRLAILDLSPAGHQPICNEDRTVWTVYNGEIYNFIKLRKELIEAGHTFYSNTDTEVLVHLYEESGESMVERLQGMFAFAIWDEKKSRLLLVRDRIGIKPLYYAATNGCLYFGSEIKAIITAGNHKPTLNRNALIQYLALGFVAPPETLFSDIQKLEPGHIIVADESGIRTRRYWDIFQDVKLIQNCSTSEYEELILAKLSEAVRLRLVADVPVGIFLSGGIDSSLVAALAAKNSSKAIKTFTLGFKDHPELNELVYARRVADYLGAEPHEILIGADDVRKFFPRFVDFQEEPIPNPIWFATYFISKLAHESGVIVLLSGDGGDELFAGYNRWMDFLRLYKFGWKPFVSMDKPIRQVIGKGLLAFLRKPNQREIVHRGIYGEEMFWGGAGFKREQLEQILAPNFKINRNFFYHLPVSEWRGDFEQSIDGQSKDYLEWMTYSSLKGHLLEDYLMRLDKMGMGASIEGRVPFLDHEFIAFSLSIPSKYKYPDYQNKYLLRSAARRVLPADVVERRKMGFCAPIEDWLREAFGFDLAEGLEQLQVHERLFNPAWFEHVQKSFREGNDITANYWILLSLGLWYKRWIK